MAEKPSDFLRRDGVKVNFLEGDEVEIEMPPEELGRLAPRLRFDDDHLSDDPS